MTKQERDLLDEHVLSRIGQAKTGIDFTQIAARVGSSDRVVDRSLQRLRKAGKIKFNSKTGWTLV